MNEKCLLSGNIQTHSAASLETARRRGLKKLISLKIWAGGGGGQTKTFHKGSMDISRATQKSGVFIRDQAS